MAAGDVNVNALTPITGEPTTTDSLVAVNRNTNEGQIIDYNLLADKILNKLTSKAYSGLSTTSKLLVGAINELDSDVASLNSSTSGSGEASNAYCSCQYTWNKTGKVVCLEVYFKALTTINSSSGNLTLSGVPSSRRNVLSATYTGSNLSIVCGPAILSQGSEAVFQAIGARTANTSYTATFTYLTA